MTPSWHIPRLFARVRPMWWAISGYMLLTVVITYPTIFSLSKVFYGSWADNSLWIGMYWWRQYSLQHGLEYNFMSMNGAPFGTDFAFRAYEGLVFILAGVASITNEIAAYNIVRLVGLVLTATLTYRLAGEFVERPSVRFLAGLIMAFSPYGIIHTMNHVDQAQLWLIPLFLLLLIRLHRYPNWQNALWLGLAFGLGGHIHAYYTYHNAITALTFFVFESVYLVRGDGWQAVFKTRRLALYGLAGAIGIALYLPELISIMQDLRGGADDPLRARGNLERAEVWFFSLSSRPWEFVLPPTTHPILGGLSQRLFDLIEGLERPDFGLPFLRERFAGVGTHWYWETSGDPDSNELYLGLTPLVLGGFALWRLRKRSEDSYGESALFAQRDWILFFGVLFVVGFLFSQPPYLPLGAVLHPIWKPLHNVAIPTPALLTMTLVSPLRISRRFVTLMLIALTLLSAISMEYLMARAKSGVRRRWLYAGVLVLVGFEFMPSFMVSPVPISDAYYWLAEQPRGSLVASYPFQSEQPILYQFIYELPHVDGNATIDSSFVKDNIHYVESMAISDLEAPLTVSKLAALGVQYVVDEDLTRTPPAGLTPVFEAEDVIVYELDTLPAPLVVLATPRDGLWRSERDWGWQGKEFGILIWNPLNGAALVEIEIDVNDAGESLDLMADRILTPHPEIVQWSGQLIENPYIPPDYPVGLLQAQRRDNGFVFQNVVIQPGETTLTLRWRGIDSDGIWPAVDDVRITLQGETD